MLTDKRFLLTAGRDKWPIGAGWIARREPDSGWSFIIWHSLPFPFFVQFGWSRRGWYTREKSEAAALQALNHYGPGDQAPEFLDEWDRLDAEERAGLA